MEYEWREMHKGQQYELKNGRRLLGYVQWNPAQGKGGRWIAFVKYKGPHGLWYGASSWSQQPQHFTDKDAAIAFVEQELLEIHKFLPEFKAELI